MHCTTWYLPYCRFGDFVRYYISSPNIRSIRLRALRGIVSTCSWFGNLCHTGQAPARYVLLRARLVHNTHEWWSEVHSPRGYVGCVLACSMHKHADSSSSCDIRTTKSCTAGTGITRHRVYRVFCTVYICCWPLCDPSDACHSSPDDITPPLNATNRNTEYHPGLNLTRTER